MLYNIIVPESFISFCVTYNIILTSNPKFKIRKINQNEMKINRVYYL